MRPRPGGEPRRLSWHASPIQAALFIEFFIVATLVGVALTLVGGLSAQLVGLLEESLELPAGRLAGPPVAGAARSGHYSKLDLIHYPAVVAAGGGTPGMRVSPHVDDSLLTVRHFLFLPKLCFWGRPWGL